MSMALNKMMIFAVIPAVLASPAPAKAQGQNSGVDLDRPEIVCAMAYEALGTMDWIQREIVNMDEIDTQLRSESLVRPLGPDHAAAAVAAGVHLRTALSSEEARTPAEIANFIGMLASCDNRFGFDPAARQRIAPQVTDRDCAAAFWLHAAFHPEQRQDALGRANHALDRHMETSPDEQRATIQQQLANEGYARGERIQQGQEPFDALKTEVAACEARYGFAAAGGQ